MAPNNSKPCRTCVRVSSFAILAAIIIAALVAGSYLYFIIPSLREAQKREIFREIDTTYLKANLFIKNNNKKRIKIENYDDLNRYTQSVSANNMPRGLVQFRTPNKIVNVYFVSYSKYKSRLDEINKNLYSDGIVSVSNFGDLLTERISLNYGCEVFIVESLHTANRLVIISYADFFINNSNIVAQSCLIEELIHGITGWADTAVSLPLALDSILANPPNFKNNTYVFPTAWDKEQFNRFLETEFESR